MFKKVIIAVLLISIGLATERVPQLKAYDGSYKKLALTDRWQNYSKTVLIEWKEPLGDIKEYRYYFGKNKDGLPTEKTTNLSYLSNKLPGEGIYYFRIAAYDVNGVASAIRTLTIKYDDTIPANALTAACFSNESKTQAISTATPQAFTNKPLLVFNLNDIKPTGAPLKGINIYWGPDKNGQPDRQIYGSQLKIDAAVPKNTTYYLLANIEDEAGNVSETKNLFSFTYNGTTPELKEKPKVVIINRDIKVDNTKNNQEVLPGSTITYTIQLNNQGNAPAYNVELKDTIPNNTTCVLNSGKSNIPALIEYWDESLNSGHGAWTTKTDAETSLVTKIRWIFSKEFNPVTNTKDPQATIAYSVQVNQ